MSYLKKIASLSLALGLMLSSCSKEEPNASLVEPTTEVNNKQAEATQTISFSLDAGFGLKETDENTTRAFQGSTFYRGRLRPNISGNTVDVWVYLASKDGQKFYKKKLSFEYDKKANSIHYRGDLVDAPQDLLTAPNLKMLLLVANDNKIIKNQNQTLADTLTMRNVNTEYFLNKQFADDESLVIDVPYFSNWIEVSKFVNGNKLDVARSEEGIKLRPKGHIIKMDLTSSFTELENVGLLKLRLESNIVSENGTYTLPSTFNDVDKMPEFNPELTAPNTKFRQIDLPLTGEAILNNNQTRTIFLWVDQIPNTTDAPWTRAFAELKYNKPVLDKVFAEAWWNGLRETKHIPVYYTDSRFQSTGSTMSMNLDNVKMLSPFDRLGYTPLAGGFSNAGYSAIDESDQRNKTPRFGAWQHREYANYTRYTWAYLASKNWVGANPVAINPPSGDQNTINDDFYVPTLEEFRTILPTDASLGPLFRLNGPNTNNNSITINERAKLGDRKFAAQEYESTFKYYKNLETFNTVLGIRFKGGDNRYKAIYRYRAMDITSGSIGRIQAQTLYLGEFYPEINTPDNFREFIRKYPKATIGHAVERMLPRNTAVGFIGNQYWVNNPSGNNVTYVKYDYNNGVVEEVTVPATDMNVANTVLLLRDY